MMRVLLWLCMFLPCAAAALPRLDLDVRLEPQERRLEARADFPVTGPVVRFLLHASLTVRRAELDGRDVRLDPRPAAGGLREWRADVPRAGGRLRIDYGGELPALDRGLDHREVLAAMPPMASAQGSFLPDSGGWYPRPAGSFAYRVSLSLPATQRGLVPGNLSVEDFPDARSDRYRARYDFPHPADGIDLMAGPWVLREKRHRLPGGEEVRVRTWFDAELDAVPGLAQGYLDDAARYLSRYSTQIGAYPWRQFSIVAAPLPAGFGMPALAYIGSDVLKLPFIRASSLGHEVLHNWWGNGVRVDAGAGNWSEGLATFMADHAYREESSAQAARDMRLSWLRDAAAVPPSDRRPLSAFRVRAHAAGANLGYGKAAMVFLMLRDEIGEQAFARGLRLAWEQHRFRAASWADLRAVFEQTSNRKLDRFFSQWLHRADTPHVRIVDARRAAGGTEITLEQDGQPYDLLVALQLQQGESDERRMVRLSERRRTVLLDAGADVVRLDPELRLWRELDAAQRPPIWREWIAARAPRLILLSEDTGMRIAAQALAAALFDHPPVVTHPAALGEGSEPALLVGLHVEVDRALAQGGLPPRPPETAGRGSAQAWTLARRDGARVAVISAADARALGALSGPLPHYGGQSWLVFEGGRAVARGIWPANMTAVPVRDR